MVQKSGVHQLRLVVYPIIYKAVYISGGAGILPSTVSINLNKEETTHTFKKSLKDMY